MKRKSGDPRRSAGAGPLTIAGVLSGQWLPVCVLVIFTGVAAHAHGEPVTVTDDRGVLIHLQQPARRIVTLTPHLTELVFAAGAGDRLAGVARFSNYPPEARVLPVVGDALHVDVERLLALKTDLVLAWRSGTPLETVARIERAGLPVFVSDAKRLEDVGRAILAVAALAGTKESGARAGAAFARGLTELHAARHQGKPLRVFYEIWPSPLMTVSKEHVISEIIALCGGVNVFGGLLPLTPEVSLEALLAVRPEVVLGGTSAETPAAYAARWAARPLPLSALPAHYIEPDLIQRPTPRLLDGVRQVCAHLESVRASRR
ncbi:MAG: helical backbone metal receptor [Burkholderiales bacterium]|nr:helical backbone metal receptor [Burkholderiales bacterium]